MEDRAGAQDWKLEVEAEAETTEKHCLLAHWLSYLSYTAQVHLLRESTTHSGLDPPISIKKMHHRHAHRPI